MSGPYNGVLVDGGSLPISSYPHDDEIALPEDLRILLINKAASSLERKTTVTSNDRHPSRLFTAVPRLRLVVP